MKRTFIIWVILLFYIEILFHVFCFHNISFSNLCATILFLVPICILFTYLCGISKNKKVNTIIFRVLASIILIIFISEGIYYKIYDSFFSYNSFIFLGAVKDGFSKVWDTFIHNILGIFFLLIPLLFIFSPLTKDLEQNNKKDGFIFCIFAMLFYIYGIFFINSFEKDENYSMYNLYYNLDLPVYNTKDFGLLTFIRLSINRGFSSFEESTTSSEDIYSNIKTSLFSSVDIKYNDLAIDFNHLRDNESNKKIKEIHDYMSKKSSTNQNEYTGIFKDKNVIFILAESLSNIAIDKDLTPTLYKMYNEGYHYTNYYSPKYKGGTADGKYMLEWGLLPVSSNDYSLIDLVYITHPYQIASMFHNNGYKTHAYHNYYGYYNLRDKYFKTLDLDSYKFKDELGISCTNNYHSSDLDMINASFSDYSDDDKFFTYYITLSGHGDYNKNSNPIVKKNWDKVKNLNYSTNLKGYLAANIEFDKAMEELMNKLEDKNKLDDTIFVVSSDHMPYFLSNSDMKAGYKTSINKFNKNKGTFFVYSPSKKGKEVKKTGMNIDVLPTLYNFMGFSYDSRLLMGNDLMSDSEGLAILSDRSFITDKGKYNSSNNKFIKNKSVDTPDNYVKKINDLISDEFKYSNWIQYNDYYKYIDLGGNNEK